MAWVTLNVDDDFERPRQRPPLPLTPGEQRYDQPQCRAVQAMRGGLVDSAHRGAGAVVDVEGRVVMAFGDAEQAVYPRSAVKALQALPLVEAAPWTALV